MGEPISRRSDLHVFASADGGRTWRTTLAARSSDVIYIQPQLAVDLAGRAGLLAIAIRDGAAGVQLFVSPPRRLAFGPPLQVTSTWFDPALGADFYGARWIGDYQGLAATPGGFRALWNDTRTGRMEIFTAQIPGTRHAG